MSIGNTLKDKILSGLEQGLPAVGGLIGQMKNPAGGRIDTHHHILPKVYLDAVGSEVLGSVTPYGHAPEWSLEATLDLLDKYKIDKAIVSISSGPMLEQTKASALARQCNEYVAELKRDHPGKFGSFASVPLPSIAAALQEIEYAMDTLHAEGFILLTNYDGKYLGAEAFEEVMQELNRRKATVLIHPTKPPYELKGSSPESVIEFPFETTRAAVSLLYSGATMRYQDIKFILSHAGGTLPYLTSRVKGGVTMNDELRHKITDVDAELKKFYFDTALAANKTAMSALLEITDPSHIVFGSDYPYAPEAILPISIGQLNGMDLPEGLLPSIYRTNAMTMLGKETAWHTAE